MIELKRRTNQEILDYLRKVEYEMECKLKVTRAQIELIEEEIRQCPNKQ